MLAGIFVPGAIFLLAGFFVRAGMFVPAAIFVLAGIFVFCCFTPSQVNIYGHGETVSSPNHTFNGQA